MQFEPLFLTYLDNAVKSVLPTEFGELVYEEDHNRESLEICPYQLMVHHLRPADQ
jgi:hypothetical protein